MPWSLAGDEEEERQTEPSLMSTGIILDFFVYKHQKSCIFQHETLLYFTVICSFSVAARPQELRLSTALPPDTAGLLIDYRYDHYQVQRELRLLVDVPDEWRTELHSDAIQSDAWRRDHGRQYTWRIGVDAATFLRDAAFSLPYTRGYTATGFFVKPYAKHLIGQDAR